MAVAVQGPVGAPKLVVSTTASTLIPTLATTFPARTFNSYEYHHYRHLSGMPKYIPQITKLHYIAVILPLVGLLGLCIHHRQENAKDLAEEYSKTKRIRFMLGLGVVFSTIVICVHLRIIPVAWVRVLFPRWKVPPPMPKSLKILIVFCFLAFIVYPVVKFLRRKNVPPPRPEVHKLAKEK